MIEKGLKMITNYSYTMFTLKDLINALQIAFPIWVIFSIIIAFAIYWKYR